MKYAVEARIYKYGSRIDAKVRVAEDGEEDSHQETWMYDIYVDIFDSKEEAYKFCTDYKRA